MHSVFVFNLCFVFVKSNLYALILLRYTHVYADVYMFIGELSYAKDILYFACLCEDETHKVIYNSQIY